MNLLQTSSGVAANSLQKREPEQPVLLSPVEDLFWRVEESLEGAYRVAILLRIDGCIEVEFLAIALQQLQQRHPKLRATIAPGADRRPRYQFDRRPQPIPFEIRDFEERTTPWREETRRLLQIRFPATGPMAAVTVLRNRSHGCSELILTVHHAIADGLSAVMLMDSLLTEYAKAEVRVNPAPLPLPALPVVTAARAKYSAGWRARLRLFLRIIRMQREEKRVPQTPLPQAPDIPPQSQWVHWVFSREETLSLVRRCRDEQTSLGGATIAAVLCGLIDCLPLASARFKCQFPFDLRGVLEGPDGPVSNQDLGCFATVMSEFFEVPRNQPFWELARKAHQKINWFVQEQGPSFNHNIASTAVKLLDRAPRRLLASSNTRVTLLATNYGVLNMNNTYGSLRPQECTLTFKNDVVGPALIFEALVLAQRLNIGFAADGLEPAFWEQLHAAVRKYLNAAAVRGTAPPAG
jgi:Condensation domain